MRKQQDFEFLSHRRLWYFNVCSSQLSWKEISTNFRFMNWKLSVHPSKFLVDHRNKVFWHPQNAMFPFRLLNSQWKFCFEAALFWWCIFCRAWGSEHSCLHLLWSRHPELTPSPHFSYNSCYIERYERRLFASLKHSFHYARHNRKMLCVHPHIFLQYGFRVHSTKHFKSTSLKTKSFR